MSEPALDPAEYPGTPEYEEIYEERARRAYLLRLAMTEEMNEDS